MFFFFFLIKKTFQVLLWSSISCVIFAKIRITRHLKLFYCFCLQTLIVHNFSGKGGTDATLDWIQSKWIGWRNSFPASFFKHWLRTISLAKVALALDWIQSKWIGWRRHLRLLRLARYSTTLRWTLGRKSQIIWWKLLTLGVWREVLPSLEILVFYCFHRDKIRSLRTIF